MVRLTKTNNSFWDFQGFTIGPHEYLHLGASEGCPIKLPSFIYWDPEGNSFYWICFNIDTDMICGICIDSKNYIYAGTEEGLNICREKIYTLVNKATSIAYNDYSLNFSCLQGMHVNYKTVCCFSGYYRDESLKVASLHYENGYNSRGLVNGLFDILFGLKLNVDCSNLYFNNLEVELR